MQTITRTPDTTTPTTTLAEELQRMGFVPGKPPSLPEHFLAIDRRVYARQKCAGCSRRTLDVQPYHRGGDYALLLRCKVCGACEIA